MVARPAISFVVFGRNDNYGGDYAYRVNTTINHLGIVAERVGVLDEIELVYVDWGSTEPICEALQLNESAARIGRFLQVSPEQAARLCPRPVLHTTLITNIGARRATGEYVIAADSDTLYPDASLLAMVRVARGTLRLAVDPEATLFPIRRYQIPYDRVRRQPSVVEWDRLLPFLSAGVRTEAPGQSGIGGFAAALMMHATMWERLGGYNEKLIGAWGWVDNDLMLRAMQNHTWFDLAHFGVCGMHMEHAPRRLEDADAGAPKLEKINRMIISGVERPSGANWGAPYERIELKTANVVALPAHVVSRCKPLSGAFVKRANFEHLFRDKCFAAACEHLCGRWAFGRDVPTDERDATLVLHGFCVSEYPGSLLYVGEVCAPALAAVFAECRTIETVLVAPWSVGDANDLPFSPANFTIVASVTGYQGYSRLVSGTESMCAALAERLTVGMKPLELVVLDRRSVRDVDDEILTLAIEQLAPGGLILVIDGDGRPVEHEGVVSGFDRIDHLFPGALNCRRTARAPVVVNTPTLSAHNLAGGGVTAIFATREHAGAQLVSEPASAWTCLGGEEMGKRADE